MQAAYTLTRLTLFVVGWSIAAVLALAADDQLPGLKWPILGLAAALWTFVYALYVAGEARSRDSMEIRSGELRKGPEPL